MTRVVFREAAYDDAPLSRAVSGMIDSVAGGIIGRGSRVLIKPNLLLPAKPERGIITHPLIVRAIAAYSLSKGARVQISDSPAIGSIDRIWKEGGYREAMRDLDVSFLELVSSVRKDIGAPFGAIEIARDALEADVVINVPKMKTHAQMLLTLGVKNIFGCIVGMRKPEWHFRAGVDREMFARLLVQVYEAVSPTVTILDGILALEGNGPGRGGTPRNAGILACSRSAHALDAAVCMLLGIDPAQLPTHRAAKHLGLIEEPFETSGRIPRLERFRLPVLAPLFMGPKPLHRLMRRFVIQRPSVERRVCTGCEKCRTFCPAGAIRMESGVAAFDYERCIRCYCCIEVCPQGGLTARETLPGRLFRRIRINRL